MGVIELPDDYYDEMRSRDKPKNKLIGSTKRVVVSRMTSLSNILDPCKFSDFKHLIRVTIYLHYDFWESQGRRELKNNYLDYSIMININLQNFLDEGNVEGCSEVPKIWEFEATTWLVFR